LINLVKTSKGEEKKVVGVRRLSMGGVFEEKGQV